MNVTHKSRAWKWFAHKKISSRYLIFFLIAVFLSGVLIEIHEYHYKNKINGTISYLRAVRYCVKIFKEVKGRYPSSIEEVRVFSKTQDRLPSLEKLYVDFKGCPQTEVAESDVLNGKGGYYYDNKSGKVRINMIHPVKYYFKFYFGPYRNDVPSEW